MKKFCLILVSLIFFLSISNATNYSSDPEKFISELVEDAISKLSNKKISDEEKSDYIEKIALENVDIQALGLYTLGELRKSADKKAITNYQKSFEKYFLKSLTSRLTDYSTSKFEIVSEDKKSATYTIINSKVIPNDGGPEIKIDWRIYTKDPEKPLIRDLIVEGLSLARTQKEEFASILSSNNNDLNILINKLEEFVNNWNGGPIINEDGELIGVAVAGLAKDVTEGINFGIKATAAERFLKLNNLKVKNSFFSSSKSNDQLLNILEDSTVYTYCN